MSHATKERILDAAERLFAEHGFAETSLRAITAEADANLAAVNYYFQSKEALIQAVFARRLEPLSQDRLSRLDALEAQAAGGAVPLEDILRAFLAPVFKPEHCISTGSFGRLLGRKYIDSGDTFDKVFHEQIATTKVRFTAAVRRTLPGLKPEDLYWKLHWVIGAMAHTVAGLQGLKTTSEGLCDTADPEAIQERLIAFLAAGIRAGVPDHEGEPPCKGN